MSPSQYKVAYYCGICTNDLNNTDSIECGQCEAWVHADVKCSGISPRHFKLLSESAQLTYVCSNCKDESRNAGRDLNVNKTTDIPKTTKDPSPNALAQLISTVQTLAHTVQTLHDDMTLLKPLIQTVHSLTRC